MKAKAMIVMPMKVGIRYREPAEEEADHVITLEASTARQTDECAGVRAANAASRLAFGHYSAMSTRVEGEVAERAHARSPTTFLRIGMIRQRMGERRPGRLAP